MGVDPGLTRCGLSTVEAGSGRAVYPLAVGVVRTPAHDPLATRLLKLSNAVTEWIADYHPDVVVIERVFERGEVSTVMHTAHAVGVIALAAAKAGLDVYMYTPSEVKKAVSGNGRADKKQMTLMVTRILGLGEPPKPADAADALALAICHCWRGPMNQLAQQQSGAGRLAELHRQQNAASKHKQTQWGSAIADRQREDTTGRRTSGHTGGNTGGPTGRSNERGRA